MQQNLSGGASVTCDVVEVPHITAHGVRHTFYLLLAIRILQAELQHFLRTLPASDQN